MMLPQLCAFIASVALAAPPELLPPPQKVEWLEGAFILPQTVRVSLPRDWAGPAERYLWILDETLQPRGDYRRELIVDGKAGEITIYRPAGGAMAAEGYVLEVGTGGVRIGTSSANGVFNALATLAQLIEQSAGDPVAIPACRISDSPELPVRAVHIDLTCQQYTARYVQDLMRTLARYKVNAILMEYSDMFPFREHAAIRRADAFTEQDVRAIRETAAACNQELIPFLQCLGHLQYVLHRPEYAAYGAAHDGYMLCPSFEATMPFVRELIEEILAQHPKLRYLHVGGDEVSPGKCEKCLAYTGEHNFSELYVRHYSQVAEYCKGKGVVPLMWSDMVLQHPEALAALPRNVTWVVWDYGTTTDPTPSLWHGAQVGKLDQLKATYREQFGNAIGLAGVERRGGLVAFGHALGFRQLGFNAFTGPAARCSGDNFDLPRYELHMANSRLAFLKAAAFGLPGSIVTSWSYRGSPHEVCLPEYVCVSYGWNTKTPQVADLLARFFRQRYGIEDAALAQAVLADSSIVPPSTLAQPTLDDDRRAWVVTPATQLEQVKHFVRDEPDKRLAEIQECRARLTNSTQRWQEAMAMAQRHQGELRYWDLSRRHLVHRLQLLEPLAQLTRVAYFDAKADNRQIEEWKGQLDALAESRETLRSEWSQLYREIMTPGHLEVALYTRFDAETAIIQAVLSGE